MQRNAPARHTKNRGFTLIETMIALLVAAVATAFSIQAFVSYAESISNNAAAGHASKVMNAALNFVADNRSTILASAGPTTPYSFGVAPLLAGGYLPAGFNDRNVYGGQFQVRICEPTAGKLDGFIMYTGGEVISGKNLRDVANSLGVAGGYVEGTTGLATGAYGNWSRNLSDCGGSATVPGQGKMVIALFVEESAEQAASGNYMHRTSVAGRPELNRMGVNLDMGGNELRNAGRVYATGRIAAGEYVELQAFATPGAACSPNGLVARNSEGRMLSCVLGLWTLAN